MAQTHTSSEGMPAGRTRLTVSEAAAHCGMSMSNFKAYVRQGAIMPAVPGGRGRGKAALFDVPSLDRLMGREPKKGGRPRGGLDANSPAVIERTIQEMAREIQKWNYRERTYLLGTAIDAGILNNGDLRRFPADPFEYTRTLITALWLAGTRDASRAATWPVLLVSIRRLQVAGASIETTVAHLEIDDGLVRRFRATWDSMTNPRDYQPQPSDIIYQTPVPITPRELATITRGPQASWGWRTIKTMRAKNPKAVERTARHKTLTGREWQEAHRQEIGGFDENMTSGFAENLTDRHGVDRDGSSLSRSRKEGAFVDPEESTDISEAEKMTGVFGDPPRM